MESTLWCFQQYGKYNVDFPLRGKNGLKFSEKLELKYCMFHNVQGKYRNVIAFK